MKTHRTVIVNTSPLFYLHRLDCLDCLEKLYGEIIIPKAVMLELHKRKAALPPSAERERIEREIAVTDEKIDDFVYELYGVMEEKRKVIEGDVK